MNKKYCLALCLIVTSIAAQAQGIWDYNGKETNKDNLGIYTSLAINTTAGLHSVAFGWSPAVKGAQSITPAIGCYYQKGISNRLSLRFGFSIGTFNAAFRHAHNFDSLTSNFTPTLSSKFNKYQRVNNWISYAMPQADIGYIFGPFKKLYLIEVRAGMGLQAYMGSSSDTIIYSRPASVYDSKRGYRHIHQSQYNNNYGKDGLFGTATANIYIGMRWQKTTSWILNHSALGFQATIPVGVSTSGYTDVVYINTADNSTFGIEKVRLSMLSFGIRATYNFL